MSAVIDAIIFAPHEKWLSPYYSRLKKHFGGGDYMFRRNELFARCFEKYIQMKTNSIGISNKFLNDTKYDTRAYLSDQEMKPIIPLMDELIKGMASKL